MLTNDTLQSVTTKPKMKTQNVKIKTILIKYGNTLF